MKYFSIALLWAPLTIFYSVAQAGDDSLETITVTVSRTPLDIRDTGSSVSIINREQILRRNASNLGELLRDIPGLAVSQQGSSGAITQVRIRGAEANQVLVLIDGVEANDISQGSEFNFTHLNPGQVERIEIVRGPQSALWGSDALSGVINIITTPGSTPGTKTFGYAEGGSFSTVKAGIAVQHGSDRHNLKISADYLDTEGTNISRTGNEDDGYRNATFNLSGRFSATDNLGILYNLRKTNTSTSFDDIDFINTGLPVDADFETDSDQLYAGLTFTYDSASLNHRLSFTRADFDNKTTTAAPVDSETSGSKDQVQYQANLNAGNHILTGILEYEEEKVQQRGEASFFGDPNKNLDASTNSLAFEYRYKGDALNLSLSARHDENSEFENSNPWRATAAWHLGNKHTTLSASVGESTKNPTFAERFGFFDTFVGNPDLKPEKSLSWEVGIRRSLLDENLLLSGTWFSAKLKNEINGFVFDPALGVFTAENVSGDSHREGVELVINYQPINRLTLAGNYTYLDATEEAPSGNDVTEVRRPKHSGTLSANYSWSRANLDLSVTYTGDQEDFFFPPYPPFQERVDLDSFLIATLTGSYRLNDNVELTFRLDNALNEGYEEVFGYSSPGFAAYGGVRLAW